MGLRFWTSNGRLLSAKVDPANIYETMLLDSSMTGLDCGNAQGIAQRGHLGVWKLDRLGRIFTIWSIPSMTWKSVKSLSRY